MFFRFSSLLLTLLLTGACSGPLNSDPDATAGGRAPAPQSGAGAEAPEFRRSPLPVGEAVPRLAMPDQKGIGVSTPELITAGDTVLVFYPGAQSPEARPVFDWVRRMREPLAARGAELLLVGPETPPEASAVAEAEELRVGILYDAQGAAAGAFGLLPNRSATRTGDVYTVIFGREGRILQNRRGLPDITEIITTLTVRPEGGRYSAFDLIRE